MTVNERSAETTCSPVSNIQQTLGNVKFDSCLVCLLVLHMQVVHFLDSYFYLKFASGFVSFVSKCCT